MLVLSTGVQQHIKQTNIKAHCKLFRSFPYRVGLSRSLAPRRFDDPSSRERYICRRAFRTLGYIVYIRHKYSKYIINYTIVRDIWFKGKVDIKTYNNIKARWLAISSLKRSIKKQIYIKIMPQLFFFLINRCY